MRDLYDQKSIDHIFIRTKNCYIDIATKNASKEIFERHTRDIRESKLIFIKEDV